MVNLNMKAPSFFSVVLLFIFITFMIFGFDKDVLDSSCLRKVEFDFHWNLYLPIFFILTVGSIVEGYRSFNYAKSEFLTLICVSPILIVFVISLFKVIISFILV